MLVVRRSENLPFVRANEQHQLTDDPTVVRPEIKLATLIVHTSRTQNRISVTSSNLSSWLCEAEFIASAVDPDHHTTLNNVLRISVGDTLYVSRRRAVPEVCLGPHRLVSPFSRAQGGSTPLGRVRTRVSESAQNLGVSDVISLVL